MRDACRMPNANTAHTYTYKIATYPSTTIITSMPFTYTYQAATHPIRHHHNHHAMDHHADWAAHAKFKLGGSGLAVTGAAVGKGSVHPATVGEHPKRARHARDYYLEREVSLVLQQNPECRILKETSNVRKGLRSKCMGEWEVMSEADKQPFEDQAAGVCVCVCVCVCPDS